VEWTHKDGDYVHKGLKFGKVSRNAHKIVVDERVVLNFVQGKSGIATLTKILFHSFSSKILGSSNAKCTNNLTGESVRAHKRKIRVDALQSQPRVLIGGGKNHRTGLFDMEMIKDNHISSSRRSKKNLEIKVKVETRTLEEVKKVLEYWIQDSDDGNNAGKYGCIPLENGDVDVMMLNDAVELINGGAETEKERNMIGALTHSVNALDISLKIDTELALESRRRTKRA
ncbi:LOW QUALITY PROTEIN: hypothetical protein HID58_076438, partial [Brassica napus]